MKEHLEQIQAISKYISKKYPETADDMLEIIRIAQEPLDEIARKTQIKKDKKKLAALRANRTLEQCVWNQLKNG